MYTILIWSNAPATRNLKIKIGKKLLKTADFLVRQIELLKPKLLVCNGKPVCEWFKESFKKKEEKKATWGQFETPKGDHTFYVVYSGFIGQIDKWARRRLGVEIENQARKLGIWPSA